MKNFDIRENTMKEEGTERTSNGEIVVAPPNRRQQDDEKPSFGRYTFSKILSQLCFRHSNHTCTSSCDERIRQVATQAILYSLVYLNTFIWPIVSGALGNKPFTGYTTSEIMTEFVSPAYFAFHVFFWISYPLQGFLDFFVYTRVKVQEWKRVDSTVSTFYIYRLVLFGVPLPETKQPPIDLDGFNPNACRPEWMEPLPPMERRIALAKVRERGMLGLFPAVSGHPGGGMPQSYMLVQDAQKGNQVEDSRRIVNKITVRYHRIGRRRITS